MWPTPTLVTAYNLVPSLMHLLSCCRSFTSTAYCTIRREQRWATYTDVVSERWTHTHSLVTCKHPHSFTQTNTHTDILFFRLMIREGGGGLSFAHKQTFPHLPPPLRSMCVLILNFAWLLIWAANGTPACCPARNTHIWGVKRIIHCFHHTTKVFELKEQLPSHS